MNLILLMSEFGEKRMPLISIVMVGYNGEKYLDKALGCILSQSCRDYELVFVNNGSNDRTKEIIEKFKKSHSEIEVIIEDIQVNKGLPNGRNHGLELAKGDYVMFHDIDDWMEPDCLEVIKNTIIKYKPERIVQQVNFVNEVGDIVDIVKYPDDASKWTKNILQGDVFLMKTIRDNGIRFDLQAYFDDFYFINVFNSIADNVIFIRQSYYNMLMRSTSMTHKYSTQTGYFPVRIKNTYESITFIMDRLKDTKEKNLYEYNALQLYYTYVFKGADLSLKDKYKEYIAYNSVIKEYYPNYLKNKNIKLFGENGFCGHFKRNIWISAQFEKFDKVFHTLIGMKLLLTVYHIALKTGAYKYVS